MMQQVAEGVRDCELTEIQDYWLITIRRTCVLQVCGPRDSHTMDGIYETRGGGFFIPCHFNTIGYCLRFTRASRHMLHMS